MAALVAPVYQLAPRQERILQFKGWNVKSVIDDGEMRDMYNLSSDEYPCLYQRKPRGLYDTGIPDLKKPTEMLVKHKKLAIISDGQFYYDGTLYPQLKLSDKTQMVSINTRICFFPEKMYFNVLTGEIGPLDVHDEFQASAVVTSSTITFNDMAAKTTVESSEITIAYVKGAENRIRFLFKGISDKVSSIVVGTEAVVSGVRNDASWIPTEWSVKGTVEKLFSGSFILSDVEVTCDKDFYSVLAIEVDESFMESDLVFISLGAMVTNPGTCTGFMAGTLSEHFKVGDAISLEVESDSNYNVSSTIESITGNSITFPDETFINVIAEGEESASIESGTIHIDRSCPDLDFVMESNNRLWGASNEDNTIYACKLGDPTNWAYFQGTTMDSYYAEQGTDGEWTGCAAYSTHLLFFKEDYIHKVYGSKPSTYQIETAQCHALEKGSSKSIAIINETVLYKSRLGIMAYAGGTPFLISENFGIEKFTNAVAGTDGIKYYVSVLKNDEPILLVYDMEKYLWHKEDDTRMRDICYHNGKLLYINENDNLIYEMDSDNPLEDESEIKWMTQLGPFDEYIEQRKVYSQLDMRLTLDEFSSIYIYISVDDGEWEPVLGITDHKEHTQYVPIVPRRCNKFSVKLEGTGRCKIESLVRRYRDGTGRRDVR